MDTRHKLVIYLEITVEKVFEDLLTSIVPMAKQAKVIDENFDFNKVYKSIETEFLKAEAFCKGNSANIKSMGYRELLRLMYQARTIEKNRENRTPSECALDFKIEKGRSFAPAMDGVVWLGSLGVAVGFLNAIIENANCNARRATNGRRLIGSTSRDRVRHAAASVQHLSKDVAASAIAGHVGLSPATVRRYLTEMYPGQNWNASTDT